MNYYRVDLTGKNFGETFFQIEIVEYRNFSVKMIQNVIEKKNRFHGIFRESKIS